MNNAFETARQRCLQTPRSGALGQPFAAPWFDPLSWQFDDFGGLEGLLPLGLRPEGYHDLVHGGAIAALIDAAMTHCLFGHEIMAVTAELKISYKKPLVVGAPTCIRAALKEALAEQIYKMTAVVSQNGETKAEAAAVFFRPLSGGPLGALFNE